MTEAEIKARKILRSPEKRMVTRDVYFYKGQRYTIVEGRALTPHEAVEYDEEQRLRQRT
jgi:hypothetical protein